MKTILPLLFTAALMVWASACDDDDNTNENNTVEICDNGLDDDGNGLADCEDTAACADFPACIPQEVCDDGEDNDGDGDTDCDDADCVDDAACADVIKHVTIIGTSDLHSHLMGVGSATDYSPTTLGDDTTLSGLSRIAGQINSIRQTRDASGIPTLLVDSGDCLMGDMVDLLSGSAPPVYHYFKYMGYDAVTLGNHDFDWTPKGTAVVIGAARNSALINFDIPLISSNLQTSSESAADDGIEALIEDGVIRTYVIKQLDDDFAVGIFGKMGIEADSNVPQAKPLTWWHDDPEDLESGYARTQALVDEIRTDGADMIVHASHQGIVENGLGEDRDVASNVTGIDVIMSGHRHQILDNPKRTLKVGNTYIIATGRRGEYVDQIDVAFNLTLGQVEDATGYVHPIDDTVMGDATMAGIMNMYIGFLDSELLTPVFGMTYSATPIAHTTFDIEYYHNYNTIPVGSEVETAAGCVAADAMRAVMNTTIAKAAAQGLPLVDPTFDASPIFVAVAENGAIRDSITAGNTGAVAAADAFRLFPLGIGPDGLPGYPMLSIYLTLSELKIMLNMNVETLKGNVPFEYYLYPSGVRFVYDDGGGQFDRVVGAFKCPDADPFTTKNCYTPGVGEIIDLDDATTLVRVAVDYYVALLLPEARNALGSNLIINPKYKDGTQIDMTDSAAVAALAFNSTPGDSDGDGDIDADDHNELKVWVALLYFISNFSDDWSEVELAPGVPLTYDEASDGLPSFPTRIYSNDTAPAGQEQLWRLGLDRHIEINDFCAIPGMAGAHPFCL